jgi:hypothetical protein
MIKKTLVLIIVSSLFSAGLLFLGTTVMGAFSPALASAQNALVTGTDGQTSPIPIPAEKTASQKVELLSKSETPKVSSAGKAALPSPAIPDQPLKVSKVSPCGVAPITGVTIAQLLANPNQYFHKVITLTGVATRLSDEKFLLNDGTGQIMVEVEDDLVIHALINGISITVTGKLDDTSSQYGFELDAFTLTDANGTVVVDDCDDDDINDDLDDDLDDDSDDDLGDDSDDNLDDDSDDDLDDNSDDDLNDDSGDDLNDDSGDDGGDD